MLGPSGDQQQPEGSGSSADPGLVSQAPITGDAIVAPVHAPGVPKEETIAIIALNRNCMKIMGQVTVALPEGRAAIV